MHAMMRGVFKRKENIFKGMHPIKRQHESRDGQWHPGNNQRWLLGQLIRCALPRRRSVLTASRCMG
jgi:hypothetical protein